jgi:hypothetical protein
MEEEPTLPAGIQDNKSRQNLERSNITDQRDDS